MKIGAWPRTTFRDHTEYDYGARGRRDLPVGTQGYVGGDERPYLGAASSRTIAEIFGVEGIPASHRPNILYTLIEYSGDCYGYEALVDRYVSGGAPSVRRGSVGRYRRHSRPAPAPSCWPLVA
jgi:hypothetical protein